MAYIKKAQQNPDGSVGPRKTFDDGSTVADLKEVADENAAAAASDPNGSSFIEDWGNPLGYGLAGFGALDLANAVPSNFIQPHVGRFGWGDVAAARRALHKVDNEARNLEGRIAAERSRLPTEAELRADPNAMSEWERTRVDNSSAVRRAARNLEHAQEVLRHADDAVLAEEVMHPYETPQQAERRVVAEATERYLRGLDADFGSLNGLAHRSPQDIQAELRRRVAAAVRGDTEGLRNAVATRRFVNELGRVADARNPASGLLGEVTSLANRHFAHLADPANVPGLDPSDELAQAIMDQLSGTTSSQGQNLAINDLNRRIGAPVVEGINMGRALVLDRNGRVQFAPAPSNARAAGLHRAAVGEIRNAIRQGADADVRAAVANAHAPASVERARIRQGDAQRGVTEATTARDAAVAGQERAVRAGRAGRSGRVATMESTLGPSVNPGPETVRGRVNAANTALARAEAKPWFGWNLFKRNGRLANIPRFLLRGGADAAAMGFGLNFINGAHNAKRQREAIKAQDDALKAQDARLSELAELAAQGQGQGN